MTRRKTLPKSPHTDQPKSELAARLISYLQRPRVPAYQAITLLCVLAAIIASALLLQHATQNNAAATTISISGTSPGKTFYGVGAVSGGGGDSRYLDDYPAAEQGQIMNYLFKPDYGASLQMLKVEIGADTDTSDGAEPSIEHSPGIIDCNAGYEWSLMERATSLNPNLKLYGLAWGAPGWISDHSFNSQDTINYMLAWLGCAKQHNLTISYLGGQNERAYSTTWYQQLRTALDAAGYKTTKIVAGDQFPGSTGNDYNWQSTWGIAADMVTNPSLRKAIAVIGAHDVCGYPTNGLECYSTHIAQGVGLPLWASEVGHMPGTDGAAMARTLNRGYQDASLTGYITWPLVEAMPPSLPHETYGLITADEPWSGHYSIGNMTWAIAHTTQFTRPGWHYIDSGTGYFGSSRSNGSYVTYKAPDRSNWSMVAETTTASVTQSFRATISGGLSTGPVHVWASNVNSTSSAGWFQKLTDVVPADGAFTYTLQPGYIYTFTTTSGQSKGKSGPIPGSATLKLPYSNNFSTMDGSNEAKYFATMSGAFEGQPCGGGVSGTCLQQMTPTAPIDWDAGPVYPYTIIGDNSWSNYTVTTDTLFTAPDSSAGIIGRFEDQAANPNYFNGYLFQVTDAGAWIIYRNSYSGSPQMLASGTIAPLGTDTWHTLSLTLDNSSLVAAVDGSTIGSASDSSFTFGPAGLDTGAFTSTWPIAQFRNFSVAGVNTPGFTGPVYSGLVDKCLDNSRGISANGNKVDMWSCNHTGAQHWNLPGDGTVRIAGKCLDVYQQDKSVGALADLYTCDGSTNQQWTSINDTLVNQSNGQCLEAPASKLKNGTQLDLNICNGSPGQYWMVPE